MPWKVPLVGVVMVLLWPGLAWADEHPPLDVPWWTVTPFVSLLLSIALLPLFAPHFWHSNLRKLLVSLGLGLPIAAYLLLLEHIDGQQGREPLIHALLEYVDFIILLAALYTVSGGILLEGTLSPTPLVNTAFLASGAVLANFLGTTGASMLLIRPVLRINLGRQFRRHIPVFFIFVVSNLGGLLTPLGDPPLFLGFLRGVPFFWTLALWPQFLLANGLVLAVFLVWDTLAYLKEPRNEHPAAAVPLRLRGRINFLFLLGILLAVLFQSDTIAQGARQWLSQFFPCPDIHLVRPRGAVLMALMALASLLLTPRGLRQANAFTWEAIFEVAVLFVGIFITMVPALELLKLHGGRFGLNQPWQYFWFTGTLSAFLDNAPTYLAFATLASSQAGGEIATLVDTAPDILQAISCGAVFMGAMTYIGNGPNFMVKAIADAAGYRTPSFFGYMLYSCLILLPSFVLATWLFFWP